MEIKRKAYDALKEWKTRSDGKTAMMIDGARRVGKTHLVKKFVEEEYASHIFIDFGTDLDEELKKIFENTRDLDMFFSSLSYLYRTELHRRRSAIVFDEVQLYPRARQLIKYLVADGRYDFIETGSLLSIKTNVEGILIPSEEEHLILRPLDFEEFLWAQGDNITYPVIKQHFEERKPLGPLHKATMQRFREYLLVGGMPQVVVKYAETHDFEEADRIKKDILRLYREDVGKYANGYKDKVRAIFDQIPSQLSHKEKKFSITALDSTAKTRDYAEAFLWLEEAGIVNVAYNNTDPNIGLGLNLDSSSYKLYMADTGLLISHTFRDRTSLTNSLYRDILLDKLSVNEGMIMENAVAAALISSGHGLFFFSRNNSEMRLEIDFLIQNGRKISPIEVKSSAYTTHSSLDKFSKIYSSRLSERFIIYTKDLLIKDGITHIPLYMSSLL